MPHTFGEVREIPSELPEQQRIELANTLWESVVFGGDEATDAEVAAAWGRGNWKGRSRPGQPWPTRKKRLKSNCVPSFLGEEAAISRGRDGVYVVAIAHAERRPGYWARRIKLI